jgi:superfamily II DNA or RNA helicase
MDSRKGTHPQESTDMIEIKDDQLRVHFNRFDLASYRTFLQVKRLPEYRLEFHEADDTYTVTAPARFAPLLGVEIPESLRAGPVVSEFLFDDQQEIARMALAAKRFACWSDCGLGKTLLGLEFARHVQHLRGGRVLFVTLNEIVPQWIEEAAKWYGSAMSLLRIQNRQHLKSWCAGHAEDAPFAVCNYEKFNHKTEAEQIINEIRHLSGIVIDESSRLKTGGGKQKWSLIKSARGIEYKLSLTATPAPNEIMEFASQASFLEKMRSDNEIIWTYFRRDEKTHRWTVKQHARKAFYEFMAGWSIYVRDPRKYGWRMNVKQPPPPVYFRHEIPITPEQRQLVMEFNNSPKYTSTANEGMMFAGELNAIAANKLSQAAKGFIYQGGRKSVRSIASNKPRFVADLIAGEAADGPGRGLNTLVWTVYDEEARILSKLLAGSPFNVEVLTGATPKQSRIDILERFRRGDTRVLIGRANMLGYGMNFQHCGSMVFSGFSFSYESFYQAVRRAFRHGQTKKLRVHVPVVQELEGQMWDAIGRKQKLHEESIAEMEQNYVKVLGAIEIRKERVA